MNDQQADPARQSRTPWPATGLSSGLLAAALCAFLLPFMTLTVKGCDGGSSDLYAHETVTGVDLLTGRAHAPGVVSEGGATAALRAATDRGQLFALLSVAAVLVTLAALAARAPSMIVLWPASLSVLFLCLIPGGLRGGWRGPAPLDPTSINQHYQVVSAAARSGWWIGVAATAAAVGVIIVVSVRHTSPARPAALRRLGASVVDALVVSVTAGIAGASLHGSGIDAGVAFLIAWLGIGLVYWTAAEGIRGLTVGKSIFGIRVVGTAGGIGVGRAAARFLARVIWGAAFLDLFLYDDWSWPGVLLWTAAALLALFEPGGRAPHDVMAGTSVVSVE